MQYSDKFALLTKALSHPKGFSRLLKESIKEFGTNELLRLANGFRTDKGIPHHNYVRVYHALFHEERKAIKSFCEIGLLCHKYQNGLASHANDNIYDDAPSLKMWSLYFPNAKIIGFDLQAFKASDDDQYITIQGDQSKRHDLDKILEEESELHVVLDDALHASYHQQLTFAHLFPHLSPGGYYIIEDLRFQPYGHERDDVPKTVDLLRELRLTGKWNSPVATSEERHHIEGSLASIEFYDSLQNRRLADPLLLNDSLAIIRKR